MAGSLPATRAVKQQLPVARASRFTSPTLYNNMAFVPTLAGVSAFRAT